MKKLVSPPLLLAILFFGPFLLAIALYLGRDSIGGFGQVPNPDRELLPDSVTVPLLALQSADGAESSATLRSRWSMIYARIHACDAACSEALERFYRVYLALGSDRVQMVYLAPAEFSVPEPASDLLVGRFEGTAGSSMRELFGADRIENGRLFIVDPLGNLILSYPTDADQQRLLEDLERLLDVSRIG